jgi:cytochrome d ubiquinol oxidase subunit II
MDLNTLWFLLIGVLFAGFFVLEGFDYGVGMLLPFTGKDDVERRMIINTIGPVWDGNEVWLLTAGGAMFAAFPGWYASLFSAFYIPLVVFLVGLIIRGVGLEFRSKSPSATWRHTWDWLIALGSFLPALLIGVVFANLVRGIPLDSRGIYIGSLFDLVSPFALLGGLCSLSLFLAQGALFLSLKTEGDVCLRAERFTLVARYAAFVLLVILFATFPVSAENATLSKVLRVLTLVLYAVPAWLIRQRKMGWSFAFSSLTLVLFVITVFQAIFPNVLISSTSPESSLNIYNASSSPYTLKIMSFVALIFVPVVLAYQGWTYWIFRKRITRDTKVIY